MTSLGSPALVLVFLAAAAATWVAGIYLSKTTDVIDDRFGLGDAIGGMILLGMAGTLPEIAITVSAALAGHLSLAVGNLLGGIAMQTCVLVVLDASSRRRTPLTSLSRSLSPILEAVLVLVVVSIGLLGAFLPASKAVGDVSPASLAIVVAWLAGMVVLNRARTREHWHLAEAASPAPAQAAPAELKARRRFASASTRLVVGVFLAGSAVTLFAGVVLEQSGNELADRAGVNGAVFGATILAAVTALPEVSTGIEAVRLGDVDLAMGDIFGGNAVQMTLFLVADLLARAPVLPTASAQSLWLAALGIVVTAVYVGGLVLRPERKRLALGPDSLAVVLVYALGVAGLALVPG